MITFIYIFCDYNIPHETLGMEDLRENIGGEKGRVVNLCEIFLYY